MTAYNTNDWINGGVWSRGHMSPSADWNVSDGDNAPTFYLSNMLPQNQTLNAGAWGDLENHLRDRRRRLDGDLHHRRRHLHQEPHGRASTASAS